MGNTIRVRINLDLLTVHLMAVNGQVFDAAGAAQWLLEHGAEAIDAEQWVLSESQLRQLPPRVIVRPEDGV